MTDRPKSSIDAAEAPSSTPAHRHGSGVIRRWLAGWRPILVMALSIAAAGLALGMFYFQFRPDAQSSDAAQAIKASSEGAVALLSYSPDNLDRDFANAQSHLTGVFLTYYKTFTQTIVKPMAEQQHIITTAKVVRAAAAESHPDSAVVLVYIDQTTASKDKPEPVLSSSSVLVTVTKVKGAWLISKFDPL